MKQGIPSVEVSGQAGVGGGVNLNFVFGLCFKFLKESAGVMGVEGVVDNDEKVLGDMRSR
jgi:hypothetical protein